MEIIAWLVNASVNTWISWISFLLCLCLIWMDFDYKARSKQYCRCVIVSEHCGKIIPGGPKITNVSSPMLENYAMVLFACITHITHTYILCGPHFLVIEMSGCDVIPLLIFSKTFPYNSLFSFSAEAFQKTIWRLCPNELQRLPEENEKVRHLLWCLLIFCPKY